jgi:hypothetical protein
MLKKYFLAGVVRTDKNSKIDTDGNHAPDGILGPYRQKEGSFYAIKEIWSPIHIDLEKLPKDFVGQIQVENRYGFTNLNECRFEWKLARLPKPFTEKDDIFVEAKYEGSLDYAKWKIYPSGWVRLDYQYELDGQFDLMGITMEPSLTCILLSPRIAAELYGASSGTLASISTKLISPATKGVGP